MDNLHKELVKIKESLLKCDVSNISDLFMKTLDKTLRLFDKYRNYDKQCRDILIMKGSADMEYKKDKDIIKKKNKKINELEDLLKKIQINIEKNKKTGSTKKLEKTLLIKMKEMMKIFSIFVIDLENKNQENIKINKKKIIYKRRCSRCPTDHIIKSKKLLNKYLNKHGIIQDVHGKWIASADYYKIVKN